MLPITKAMIKATSDCPCQSKQKYAKCCGRFHKAKLHVPTAQALMRSRYSAYVLGNAQYLYRTWDESTRPDLQSIRASIAGNAAHQFISLKIISTTMGGIDDDQGMVEFIAIYDKNGVPETLYEKSSFRRIKGHWIYLEAM